LLFEFCFIELIQSLLEDFRANKENICSSNESVEHLLFTLSLRHRYALSILEVLVGDVVEVSLSAKIKGAKIIKLITIVKSKTYNLSFFIFGIGNCCLKSFR